jgi:hypothetical protein
MGVGQKIICPLQRFEERLMSLTEVAGLSECCFVDSSGGGRQLLERGISIM